MALFSWFQLLKHVSVPLKITFEHQKIFAQFFWASNYSSYPYQQFRDVDAPTDVLSFPAEFSDPESGAAYLGDVLISYPRVVAQTQSGGHTPEAELQLLIVHGILHLLGHDHADEAEKNTMWAAQAEILATLGVEITPPA